MKFDIHTHHYRCGHANGNIRQYIDSAISNGLKVIGISDHTPYFYRDEDQAFPQIAMGKSEIRNYVQEVLQLKDEYEGTIDVLLGIESDYFQQHAELYRQALSAFPFDYIIGSVHQVHDVSIFNKNRWNNFTLEQKIAVKKEYYRLIQESAKSGMFQILGHIDAMKGNYPSFSEIPANETIDETLKIIAEYDVAIEINTSGKTKKSGGWYPSDAMLERALFYDVHVTFGSDAHVPERVGDELSEVSSKLKEIGYKEWVYYKQKKMQVVPLI
ncbi:histidinol-phosphatase [Paenibacillus crassostreae]|uniref:Histidinol-phosphatase n=1 Tax=Paenibacillus crassostreae TaxID=1763538 RepID=A0A167GPW4_9BACL|nr:histidinol-phosphatase [Paenibacillus crassostreae]AOZ91981.1 phosphoesterase [Paenibacillus crassostreae]OAB77788.1 phosphoesterase [Paenibacillus crassostreae]